MLQLTDVVMTVPQIVLLAVVGAFYKLDSPMLLGVIIGILSGIVEAVTGLGEGDRERA